MVVTYPPEIHQLWDIWTCWTWLLDVLEETNHWFPRLGLCQLRPNRVPYNDIQRMFKVVEYIGIWPCLWTISIDNSFNILEYSCPNAKFHGIHHHQLDGDASPINGIFPWKINEILADILHYHQTQLENPPLLCLMIPEGLNIQVDWLVVTLW